MNRILLPCLLAGLFLCPLTAHAQTFAPQQPSPASVFSQPNDTQSADTKLAWEGAADVTLALILFRGHGHSGGLSQSAPEPVPEQNTGLTFSALLLPLGLLAWRKQVRNSVANTAHDTKRG